MKVIFEFRDKNGNTISENSMEKEMSTDEIQIILGAREIAYPVKLGILYTVIHCIVDNTLYDMFTEPYKLKITLKEKI